MTSKNNFINSNNEFDAKEYDDEEIYGNNYPSVKKLKGNKNISESKKKNNITFEYLYSDPSRGEYEWRSDTDLNKLFSEENLKLKLVKLFNKKFEEKGSNNFNEEFDEKVEYGNDEQYKLKGGKLMKFKYRISLKKISKVGSECCFFVENLEAFRDNDNTNYNVPKVKKFVGITKSKFVFDSHTSKKITFDESLLSIIKEDGNPCIQNYGNLSTQNENDLKTDDDERKTNDDERKTVDKQTATALYHAKNIDDYKKKLKKEEENNELLKTNLNNLKKEKENLDKILNNLKKEKENLDKMKEFITEMNDFSEIDYVFKENNINIIRGIELLNINLNSKFEDMKNKYKSYIDDKNLNSIFEHYKKYYLHKNQCKFYEGIDVNSLVINKSSK